MVVVPCIMIMLALSSASSSRSVYYIIRVGSTRLNSCRSALEHVLHASLRHKALDRAYVQSCVDNVDRFQAKVQHRCNTQSRAARRGGDAYRLQSARP